VSGNARAAAAQSPQPAAAQSPQSRPSADPSTPAPLSPAVMAEVRALVGKLDRDQRLWLSGFLAGIEAQPSLAPVLATASAAAAPEGKPAVTVLFGSQTGNSERLARQLAERLTARGVRFTLLDMLRCTKVHLQEAQVLLLVVSTHGDGDPPERAVPLSELLHGRKAPRLDHLRYSILALGDSSYEKFCEAGRQFDARLEALGAQRLHPREECDVDFDVPAGRWIDAVAAKLEQSASPAEGAHLELAAERRTASVSNAYTRKNPYWAAVLANQRLTASGSSKDVRHIELSLAGSGIRYEPGDSIGIVPRNRTQDVEALLQRLPFAPESPVQGEARSTIPLRQALSERFEIGPVSRSFVKRYAEAVRSADLATIVRSASDREFTLYARGRHLIDLVTEHAPAGLDAASFARLLPPLAPRLYSVASSQHAAPDEAHLTVSVVQYESFDRPHRGVASGALAELTSDDATAPIYLQRNPAFRLPEDSGIPIIMIGPGTGVAPFRAFVSEREQTGATGRNWLFFGDRTFEWDFLYQSEWLEWRKSGLLTRMDVAFSRDQDSKVYVQHRMLEQGAELWRWLEDGAFLYVCGDAEQMAPDVHRALLDIVASHGARTEEDAAEYVLQLQQARRYQRDVY
jgi:sulfite reductase (NADPH) flavoprotein alpha-component